MLNQKFDSQLLTRVIMRNGLGYFLLFFLLNLFFSQFCFAKTTEEASRLIEYLTQQKIAQTNKLNEISHLKLPDNIAEYKKATSKLNVLLALNQVNQANLTSLLAEQQIELDTINEQLKLATTSPDKNIIKMTDKNTHELHVQAERYENIIDIIQTNLTLTTEITNRLNKKIKSLDIWNSRFKTELEIKTINQKINQIRDKISLIYKENIKLQNQLNSDNKQNSDVRLESDLLLNNQQALLLYSKIAVLEQQKKQLNAVMLMTDDKDVQALEALKQIHSSIISNLESVEKDLAHIQRLLNSEGVVASTSDIKIFSELQKELTRLIDKSIFVKTKSKTMVVILEKDIKKLQSYRQPLSEYHFKNWPKIGLDIVSIPHEIYLYVKNLFVKVYENYYWLSKTSKSIYWLGILSISIAAVITRRLIDKYSQDKVRLKLAGHLYDWLLILLNRNIPQLVILFVLVFSLKFLNMEHHQSYLLFQLVLVWLVFRNVILTGRLMLLERISDVSGHDVTLYYRLKHLMIYGGSITTLMVISHHLPLDFVIQDIFNRLFMLFLLALAIGIWKSKETIPYLLKPILKAKKKYIKRAVILLITLIPITLFTTAVIGLIGFSSLSWTMSRYQVDFLVVITAYVVLRGLLTDLLELISELMISKLKNGWLWIEVILKPIDKIVRILLLMISCYFLFQLYGLSSNSLVMRNIENTLAYPLINISGIHITLMSCVQFFILLYVFLWASKWTREFGYRWLFKNARDSGIRNSLSAFTQYGVILIGAFVTLRVLGIDFSGMSMILGGLAVGMGFGLRDFASNIIGGIMLLIERPVREGDLITLGDYEGRVAHIGIRSMRVSSWDNMEVLIPNAETFNKPFTNWTHQDNIVRSVIPIKVNPSDDPLFIQQLILDVLAIIPEVLDDPAPQVYLKHINEALIEFEIRYYINVLENTRFAVRSNVLFAITAQFKAAGVKPPIPPLRIEMNENEKKDNQLHSK